MVLWRGDTSDPYGANMIEYGLQWANFAIWGVTHFNQELCILMEHINIIKRAYDVYFMSIEISNSLIHLMLLFTDTYFRKIFRPSTAF